MQDEEDRVFLRAAVVSVFQQPRAADEHASAFYLACDVRGQSEVSSRLKAVPESV